MKNGQVLFISYAWDNWRFVEWLALKLQLAGYVVWLDRQDMVGGSQLSVSIEEAIKSHACKVLAIMSKSSLQKENPRRERMLASNRARAEGLKGFIIPLDVEGLSPAEFDFVTADTVHIDFRDWAAGLKELFRTLDVYGIGKKPEEGRALIENFLGREETIASTPERLWTNFFPLIEVPPALRKFRVIQRPNALDPSKWACKFADDDLHAYAFAPPDENSGWTTEEIDAIKYEGRSHIDGFRTTYLITELVRKCIYNYAMKKGMTEMRRQGTLYFKPGQFPKEELKYKSVNGKQTYTQVTGVRLAYRNPTKEVQFRYYLGAEFKYHPSSYSERGIQIVPRLHVTDLDGTPFRKAQTILGRRKKVVGSWFNYHWWTRTIAIGRWLADDADTAILLSTPEGNLSISALPVSLLAAKSIDETKIRGQESPEEDSSLLEFLDDGDNGEEEVSDETP